MRGLSERGSRARGVDTRIIPTGCVKDVQALIPSSSGSARREHLVAPSPAAWAAHRWIVVVWVLAAVLLAVGLLADHVPRFFQGDSISYISTDGVYVPPDRSWAFGFAINWLLRTSGSHLTFMAVQLVALLAVLMGCIAFFDPPVRRAVLAYAAFVAVACLDPMLELYARFYMTDLLACLCFIAFLACWSRGMSGPWGRFVRWLPGMAACVIGAVFTRVAYVPIAVLTVLIAGAWSLLYRRAMLGRMGLVLTLPFVAVGALVAANTALFSQRFAGELFLTKSSGIFLLGTFAPALSAEDFRAAGVPVSDAEVALLDLQDYDRRGGQIWGTDERSAQVLIRNRLGLKTDYPADLDSVCLRIVSHAFRRAPFAVAGVYLESLLFHFEPSQWRRFLEHEAGLTRRLPDGFVPFINRIAGPPITADITQARSPVLDAYLRVAPMYPLLLLLGGVAAACWRLLAGPPTMGGVLVGAALLAVLATAPLYTVYVIPRYVIAAIFLVYLLGAEMLAGWGRPVQTGGSA